MFDDGKPPLSPPPPRSFSCYRGGMQTNSSLNRGFSSTASSSSIFDQNLLDRKPPTLHSHITVEHALATIPSLDRERLLCECREHPNLAPMIIAQSQALLPTRAGAVSQRNCFGMWSGGRFRTTEQLSIVQQVLKHSSSSNTHNRKHVHYKVLSLQPNVTDADIKKAYRKLALKLHPDKNSAPHADEAFKAVGLAYATLSDGQKRRIYDMSGEEDPDNRGGGGARRGGHGQNMHFHGQDVSPEDGGMPPGHRLFISEENGLVYIANKIDPTLGYRAASKTKISHNYAEAFSKKDGSPLKNLLNNYDKARFIFRDNGKEVIDLSSLQDPTGGFIHRLQIKGGSIPISWNDFRGHELESVRTDAKRSGQEVAIGFEFRKQIFEAWVAEGRPRPKQPQRSSTSMGNEPAVSGPAPTQVPTSTEAPQVVPDSPVPGSAPTQAAAPASYSFLREMVAANAQATAANAQSIAANAQGINGLIQSTSDLKISIEQQKVSIEQLKVESESQGLRVERGQAQAVVHGQTLGANQDAMEYEITSLQTDFTLHL